MTTQHTPDRLLEIYADGLDATIDGRGFNADHASARQSILEAFAERDRLRALNAELLAALKAVDREARDIDGYCETVTIPSEVFDLVQQALARAGVK